MTFGIPLFRKRSRPEPMPLALQPKAGETYAHVFENPRTKLARNLFWNARIEFEPIQLDGEEWSCSLAVEWLTWPVDRWRALDRMGIGRVLLPELVECSFYLFEHHWAELSRFRLSANGNGSFEADFSATADVDDGEVQRRFNVSGKCDLNFTGIVVIADNLEPQPKTASEVGSVVAEFIALDDLDEPRLEQFRYVLKPLERVI